MINRSIADLKIGETGIIKSFTDDLISLKLLEMGCLPNTPVKMCNIALFGDPVCVKVCGYRLSLRKAEASTVIVE
ncbi:MAG: FeoA family protein [Microscillaceae bacterium]|nr:FeoA family protein [Microscillaceae bacterium]